MRTPLAQAKKWLLFDVKFTLFKSRVPITFFSFSKLQSSSLISYHKPDQVIRLLLCSLTFPAGSLSSAIVPSVLSLQISFTHEGTCDDLSVWHYQRATWSVVVTTTHGDIQKRSQDAGGSIIENSSDLCIILQRFSIQEAGMVIWWRINQPYICKETSIVTLCLRLSGSDFDMMAAFSILACGCRVGQRAVTIPSILKKWTFPSISENPLFGCRYCSLVVLNGFN